MNEVRLLEKAAESCGFEYKGNCVATNGAARVFAWHPLTDDGDALRLAISANVRLTNAIRKYIVESAANAKLAGTPGTEGWGNGDDPQLP